MKTKEELNQLKNEYESLTKKLNELSEEEIKEVVGGIFNEKPRSCDNFLPKTPDNIMKNQADGYTPPYPSPIEHSL